MVLAWLAGGTAAAFAQARAQDRIHLHTNEAEIGEVLRDGGLAIDDPLAVFGAVLKNLPERAQVYPTENYFYFRFTHKAAVYAGNIRLAAADRDRGKVNFAYNEQPTDWNPNPKYRHAVLGAEQGVIVVLKPFNVDQLEDAVKRATEQPPTAREIVRDARRG